MNNRSFYIYCRMHTIVLEAACPLRKLDPSQMFC
jgi:hypothetical protein